MLTEHHTSTINTGHTCPPSSVTAGEHDGWNSVPCYTAPLGYLSYAGVPEVQYKKITYCLHVLR